MALPEAQIDHLYPRSKSGSQKYRDVDFDGLANLALICGGCNRAKGDSEDLGIVEVAARKATSLAPAVQRTIDDYLAAERVSAGLASALVYLADSKLTDPSVQRALDELAPFAIEGLLDRRREEFYRAVRHRPELLDQEYVDSHTEFDDDRLGVDPPMQLGAAVKFTVDNRGRAAQNAVMRAFGCDSRGLADLLMQELLAELEDYVRNNPVDVAPREYVDFAGEIFDFPRYRESLHAEVPDIADGTWTVSFGSMSDDGGIFRATASFEFECDAEVVEIDDGDDDTGESPEMIVIAVSGTAVMSTAIGQGIGAWDVDLVEVSQVDMSQ